MHVATVVEIHNTSSPSQEPLSTWDEIANEPVPGGPNSLPDIEKSPPSGPVQIEDQVIPLPSNGNVAEEYSEVEISHRISHAEYHLNRIRDLIAEKSFQFSHVIRVAPRKAVNTRSRAEVKKINLQISVHCRLYSQCRSRLITLGAPEDTIERFRLLTTDDVKASTAIVNPNEPGATQLKLSWIWQASGGHRWGLAPGIIASDAGSDTGLNTAYDAECAYARTLYENSQSSEFFVYSSSCALAPGPSTAHALARRSYPYRL